MKMANHKILSKFILLIFIASLVILVGVKSASDEIQVYTGVDEQVSELDFDMSSPNAESLDFIVVCETCTGDSGMLTATYNGSKNITLSETNGTYNSPFSGSLNLNDVGLGAGATLDLIADINGTIITGSIKSNPVGPSMSNFQSSIAIESESANFNLTVTDISGVDSIWGGAKLNDTTKDFTCTNSGNVYSCSFDPDDYGDWALTINANDTYGNENELSEEITVHEKLANNETELLEKIDFTDLEFSKSTTHTGPAAVGIKYTFNFENNNFKVLDFGKTFLNTSVVTIDTSTIDIGNIVDEPDYVSAITEGFKFESGESATICFTDGSSNNNELIILCNEENIEDCDSWSLYNIDSSGCSNTKISTASIFALATCKSGYWYDNICHTSVMESETSEDTSDTIAESDVETLMSPVSSTETTGEEVSGGEEATGTEGGVLGLAGFTVFGVDVNGDQAAAIFTVLAIGLFLFFAVMYDRSKTGKGKFNFGGQFDQLKHTIMHRFGLDKKKARLAAKRLRGVKRHSTS